ncbi:MAG: preprotein translocase subunit SecE, partial [Candidatus Veblenbacteria bacterium]|nr:preprotein translocase subunit SecE [Candidatus Veblenbacteria bacterium]
FEELKKVVWPTKREILQHTLVVVGLSLALAIFLGAVDYLLNMGLEQLLLSR